MPPRRGRNLPGADKTFLDDPELVLIRPLPTANAIGRGENFDLRAVNEIGHKARLIIGSKPTSDGPRRSLTPGPCAQQEIVRLAGSRVRVEVVRSGGSVAQIL